MKNSSSRLFFLDNLKVFLIFLVIIHHAGQAYGPTGGIWFYQSSLHENIPWLGAFFSVNAAFFMGLFFLISGYFVPPSFDRHGGKKFVLDRLVRYGIPLLFALFIMVPLEQYFFYSNYSGNPPIKYFQYFTTIYFGIGSKPEGYVETFVYPEWNFGHLWFIEQLLLFSICYSLLRALFKNFCIREGKKAPGFLLIFLIAGLVAAFSFFTRLYYPIDRWIRIFGFIQSEPAHLPQYVILFVTGIIANRKGWFLQMEKKKGIALLVGGIFLSAIIYLKFLPATLMKAIFQNWAIYESCLSISLCWGLVIFFREYFDHANTFMRWLAQNSYAAYIFHFPIVLFFQFILDQTILGNALGKFLTVSFLSVFSTYAMSGVIRKIPLIRKII